MVDFFFVSCGMGGRFVVVVVWVVGFVVTVGNVVAGGAENSWVEKERNTGERERERERDRERKEEQKMNKK